MKWRRLIMYLICVTLFNSVVWPMSPIGADIYYVYNYSSKHLLYDGQFILDNLRFNIFSLEHLRCKICERVKPQGISLTLHFKCCCVWIWLEKQPVNSTKVQMYMKLMLSQSSSEIYFTTPSECILLFLVHSTTLRPFPLPLPLPLSLMELLTLHTDLWCSNFILFQPFGAIEKGCPDQVLEM